VHQPGARFLRAGCTRLVDAGQEPNGAASL